MSRIIENLPKQIFVASVAIVLAGAIFSYGVLAHRDNLPPYKQFKYLYDTISLVSPVQHHLQPSRQKGAGVTINATHDDGSLVLMAGFFEEENQIRLISRDGSTVKKWSLDYFEHFPDLDTRVCDVISPLKVDIHGLHATPRGEVILNYEYCGTVKLDQCGGLIWKIAEPTHHSLVPSEQGGYWLLGRHNWVASSEPDRLAPFSSPAIDRTMKEDTLMRISEKGEVLEEVSIPKILLGNDLEALLSANGITFKTDIIVDVEPVHANKVTELSTELAGSFPLFDAGDLAISMRELNLIIVIDPVTKKVKWHQTGPWIRQHDPEFRSDGRISIFNNNVYFSAYKDEQTDLSAPFSTNIIAIDPTTRETEVVFGEKPGEMMLSVIRGQHELLGNGGMLITEFDGGRVLEVDENRQIVWEYVNQYDENFVGEITNAAVYSKDYFQADWSSCAQ